MENNQFRDWVEDFPHENGNYMRTCCNCGFTFLGYKRRVLCKPCHVESELWYNSLTADEQKAHLDKVSDEFAAYLKNFPNIMKAFK